MERCGNDGGGRGEEGNGCEIVIVLSALDIQRLTRPFSRHNWGVTPNSQESMPIDEIDELERLVIERIQQALLGKIPELVMSLYRAIDRWCSKKEDPVCYDSIFVPSFVKNISENEKEKIRYIRVEFTDRCPLDLSEETLEKELLDEDRELGDTRSDHYLLSVIVDNKRVFSTNYRHHYRYGPGYFSNESVSGVEAYIPGEWTKHCRDLLSSIEAANAKEEESKKKATRENPERINDLKKRFGV